MIRRKGRPSLLAIDIAQGRWKTYGRDVSHAGQGARSRSRARGEEPWSCRFGACGTRKRQTSAASPAITTQRRPSAFVACPSCWSYIRASPAAFADQFEERVRRGALMLFASTLKRQIKQTLSQHQNVSVRIVERRETDPAFDRAGLAVEANVVACL